MEDNSPFKYLNSILTGQGPLDITDDETKEYGKLMFLTNRGLSQHVDCLLYVNEMNQLNWLTPKMQYDYLFKTIRKMKRPFNKWAKGPSEKDVELIQKHYNYSKKKAEDVLQRWPKITKGLAKLYEAEK